MEIYLSNSSSNFLSGISSEFSIASLKAGICDYKLVNEMKESAEVLLIGCVALVFKRFAEDCASLLFE